MNKRAKRLSIVVTSMFVLASVNGLQAMNKGENSGNETYIALRNPNMSFNGNKNQENINTDMENSNNNEEEPKDSNKDSNNENNIIINNNNNDEEGYQDDGDEEEQGGKGYQGDGDEEEQDGEEYQGDGNGEEQQFEGGEEEQQFEAGEEEQQFEGGEEEQQFEGGEEEQQFEAGEEEQQFEGGGEGQGEEEDSKYQDENNIQNENNINFIREENVNGEENEHEDNNVNQIRGSINVKSMNNINSINLNSSKNLFNSNYNILRDFSGDTPQPPEEKEVDSNFSFNDFVNSSPKAVKNGYVQRVRISTNDFYNVFKPFEKNELYKVVNGIKNLDKDREKFAIKYRSINLEGKPVGVLASVYDTTNQGVTNYVFVDYDKVDEILNKDFGNSGDVRAACREEIERLSKDLSNELSGKKIIRSYNYGLSRKEGIQDLN